MNGGERGAAAERAQSEVLGTVLLLGLTVAVVGTTVALGGAALDDTQRTADLQRVEGAMTQLDSKASLVAHGGSPSQRVSFGTGGGLSVDHDAGRMVIAENATGDEILNASLGALVYERDGTRIAYQGGGVWRSDGSASRMVSAPEFHYRTRTLTVPLVTISENATVDGDSVVLSSGSSPVGRVSENPVTDDITVTVTGDYHEGWAAFFESRTDTRIVERGNDSVTVLLRSELRGDGVQYSMGTLGSSEFDLKSIGSLTADSYDSDNETEPLKSRDNAVVAGGGEIDAPNGKGNAPTYVDIKGDLRSRYDISPNPNGLRNGNHPIDVTGNITQRADIDDPDPVDGYLFSAVEKYDARYGNATVTTYGSWAGVTADAPIASRSNVEEGLEVDEGNETYVVEDAEIVADEESDGTADADLAVEEGGATLKARGDHAGFRFDDAEISEGDLVLNVTDGDLDLRLDGDLSVSGEGSNPGRIRVVGDGNVRLYVDGELSIEGHSEVIVNESAQLRVFHDNPDGEIEIGDGDDGNGVTVTAGENDSADSFWLFSNAEELGLDAEDAPIDITGVVYAPNAKADDVEGDITIRGAFTVNRFGEPDEEEGNNGNSDGPLEEVHLTIRYDEALETAEVFDEVEEVPTINYLHVSTQEIRIEGD